MFLEKIIEYKKKEVAQAKAKVSQESLAKCLELPLEPRRDFQVAIKRPGEVSLIAELKRKSPSKGIIRKDFNIEEIAKIYQNNGVSAISVLTDEEYFGGEAGHLKTVKDIVLIPVLRKEFIIDEYQLYESCILGADAVLLIATILSFEQIKKLLSVLSCLGMQALVEVHTEEDIKKALSAGAGILGINNRDLNTFKVDFGTSIRLKKFIPEGITTVSESGIKDHSQIEELKTLGVNAVLIGEAFMEASDIATKIREIMAW